jgi:hypothetical protein
MIMWRKMCKKSSQKQDKVTENNLYMYDHGMVLYNLFMTIRNIQNKHSTHWDICTNFLWGQTGIFNWYRDFVLQSLSSHI